MGGYMDTTQCFFSKIFLYCIFSLNCIVVFAADPIQYPENMGGNWVDITKDPYNAPSDGSGDVAPIMRRILEEKKHDWTRPLGIFFPKGTYLFKSQVKYGVCCTHVIGQGPEHTTILLDNNAAGFGDPNNPKSILRTTASETNDTKNNAAFRNYVRDLTINTGSGNSGAIGLDYISSNSGAVRNVHIISGDGKGVCGLDMSIGWPGPLLIKDILVDGFDYGIRMGFREYSITAEHITVKNQKKAGIQNNNNMIAIRGLISENSVPAMENTQNNGMITLVDAHCFGGSAQNCALDNANGYLYARNVSTVGYAAAIRHKGTVVEGNTIDEYVSGQHTTLFNSPKRSLRLPIEETPEFHDNNISNWVHGNAFSNVTDLQTALNNESKTTLYFNCGSKTLKGTLRIPAHIRKIFSVDGLINVVNNYSGEPLIISVEDESENPLVIDGLTVGKVILEQRCGRTVAIAHSKAPNIEQNFPNSGKLFLEDVLIHTNFEYPQKIWARQWNAETGNSGGVPQDMIFNKGGDLWILGIKTEGRGTVVTNTNGGRTEILGSFIYPVRSDAQLPEPKTTFINRDGSMSLIYKFYGGYTYQIEDTQDGVTKRIASADMSPKIFSLFTSYSTTNPLANRNNYQVTGSLRYKTRFSTTLMPDLKKLSHNKNIALYSLSGERLDIQNVLPHKATPKGVFIIQENSFR